ncbi:hypothetical protein D3C84_637350 [compost metagenome]
MGGHGEQIHFQRFHVDRDLAHALDSVHVQQDLAGAAQLADGGDVLHHTDLVVHMHDADQDGVIAQGTFDLLQGEQAVWHRLEVGHLVAFTLQLTAGVEHRLVFGLGGDDVFALASIEVGNALDGQVVGFGRAGGEDDLARICTNQLCHLITGQVHRLFGLPAETVRAGGRIAKQAVHGEALHHFFCDTRVHRTGCRIIKVNRQFHVFLRYDGVTQRLVVESTFIVGLSSSHHRVRPGQPGTTRSSFVHLACRRCGAHRPDRPAPPG